MCSTVSGLPVSGERSPAIRALVPLEGMCSLSLAAFKVLVFGLTVCLWFIVVFFPPTKIYRSVQRILQ